MKILKTVLLIKILFSKSNSSLNFSLNSSIKIIKKIFDSSDLMSESVRNKAEAKKNAMKILSSWEKMSIIRCEKLKKK